MAKKNLRSRLLRFAMAVTIGGSVFQLGGCDPNVRSALLTGMETTSQSLSSTLITAFFLTLEDDDSGTSLTTT